MYRGHQAICRRNPTPSAGHDRGHVATSQQSAGALKDRSAKSAHFDNSIWPRCKRLRHTCKWCHVHRPYIQHAAGAEQRQRVRALQLKACSTAKNTKQKR
jgi:hypothetical protein